MEKLIEALTHYGIEVDRPPVLDGGMFNRYRYNGSDDRRAWVVGEVVNGVLYASYGTWDGDTRHRYASSGVVRTNAHYQRQARLYNQARDMVYEEAAAEVQELLKKLPPAQASNPYLVKKKIFPVKNTWQEGDTLYIPMYDGSTAHVASAQMIMPNGSKRFYPGGKTKGCMFNFRVDGCKRIWLCEGFSTGATIHEATGDNVAVAFSAGNMESVAAYIKEHFPQHKCFVACDNDHKKEPNVGLNTGLHIAKRYGFGLVVPECNGTDFNDMAYEKGLKSVSRLCNLAVTNYQAPSGSVIGDASELVGIDKTTQIPDDILFPGDDNLISIGMKSAKELSGSACPQYLYPVVMAHIAAAIAGKMCVGDVHPSCFFIKIGPTSTGKTSAESALRDALYPTFLNSVGKDPRNHIYGATEISSGPALFRALEAHPFQLIMIDEITYFFNGGSNKDPLTKGKVAALLEVATAGNKEINKVYADTKNKIIIPRLCVNLIGNATPLLFQALTIDDCQSGLVQRFDFCCYEGAAQYRDQRILTPGARSLPESEVFAKRMYAIQQAVKPLFLCRVDGDSSAQIGVSPNAAELLGQKSHQNVDDMNKFALDDEVNRGIISRRYDSMLKYAMIHAAARRSVEDLFRPLDTVDLEYGWKVADMFVQWKLNVLVKSVSAGEFDFWCKQFIGGIESCIQSGVKPYGRAIVNRRPRLRNLKPTDMDSVIKALRAQKRIRIDESTGSSMYQLLKA